MKKILLILICALGCCTAASAQNIIPIPTSATYTTPAVTGTGQAGKVLQFNQFGAPNSLHTVDAIVTGTAPIACTFQLEGSPDGLHWSALSAVTSCTAVTQFSVAYRPEIYVRINVLTYTAGDQTTSVIFFYTGGRS